MSLRKKLSYNLIIQSVGPILSFLTTFLIARFGGVEIQGKFASIVAWINLVVVIGTFGFPQSFIYLINKFNISRASLFRFSYKYTLIISSFFLPILYILFKLNIYGNSIISNFTELITIIIPISILIFHSLIRGIYLTYNQNILFASISILPASTLFVSIIFGILLNCYNFSIIYLISAIPVLIFSIYIFKPVLLNNSSSYNAKIPYKPLINHGTNAFLQALFLTLQPIVAYWYINNYIGSNTEIGIFNLGLFLIQGFLVPISMVAPLLFEHWTKNTDHVFLNRFTNFKVVVFEVIIGIALSIMIGYVIPLLFGEDYNNSIIVSQVLFCFTPIIFHSRIILPAIHSLGYPNLNTISGLIRIFAFISLFLIISLFKNSLLGLACAWSLSELLSSIFTISCFKYLIKHKIHQS